MKKIIYLVLTGIFATLLFTGCGIKGEDEIFNGTATERMTVALKEYRKLLVSSEHGWVLDYYTMTKQSKGATALICKFNENGTVEIASIDATNVPARQVEASLFDMLGTQGPVLSLSDYNPVLHYYCEPSSAFINGREQGDYEFILQADASSEEIILKGKKWGNIMTLRRMESPDWDGYFDAVKENGASINNYIVNEASLTINGVTYPTSVSSRTLKITSLDGLTTETVAYAITDDGMRFYKTIKIDGTSMRNFTYDEGTKVFTCTDPGANATVSVVEKEVRNEFLNTARYLLDPEYCSENLGQRLEAAVASVASTGRNVSAMYLGLSGISNYPWTAFVAPYYSTASFNCVIRINMGPVSDTGDKVEFTSWTTDGGLNFSSFATAARFSPIFDDMVSKSPYTVRDAGPAAQLVSDSDPTFIIGLLY